MATKRYTEEQFVLAFNSSCCWAETLRKLGFKSTGGVNAYIKNYAVSLNLDITRFQGLCMNHRKSNPGKFVGKNIETYLVIGGLPPANLKKRLLAEGLLKNSCSICNLQGEWMGLPITLQLDHINGDPRDNRLENLRILCPNCHSQTDTFAGGNNLKHGLRVKNQNKCQECSAPCSRRANWCKPCGYKNRRLTRDE